jgi:hypothetical protein
VIIDGVIPARDSPAAVHLTAPLAFAERKFLARKKLRLSEVLALRIVDVILLECQSLISDENWEKLLDFVGERCPVCVFTGECGVLGNPCASREATARKLDSTAVRRDAELGSHALEVDYMPARETEGRAPHARFTADTYLITAQTATEVDGLPAGAAAHVSTGKDFTTGILNSAAAALGQAVPPA